MYAGECPRGILRGPETGCDCVRLAYGILCTPDVCWSLQRVSARVRPGLQRRDRHRHMLGRPARLEYAGWFGARTGLSAEDGVGLGAVRRGRRGRGEGAACSCHVRAAQENGGRRLWVFGAGDRRRSGLGGCPGVGGWAEGRRAKALGLAGSGGGWARTVLRARCYRKLACWWSLRARARSRARVGWQDAFTCAHGLARVGGGIMPPRGYSNNQGDSLVGRSGPLGVGNDGQSSAPGHWALGTVQLRREELAGTGAVCGRRVFTVQRRARSARKCGGFSRVGRGVHARVHTHSLSLATVQNR